MIYDDQFKSCCEKLIKENTELLDIIKSLINNKDFCPMCGCDLKGIETGYPDHPKFCKIGRLKKEGKI